MGLVIASASMSLDGFIAYPDHSVGELFEWYANGDVEVSHHSDFPPVRLTPASAEYWRSWTGSVGALVVGRTLFDHTDGWKGSHPLGVPVVVLTHDAPQDWSCPGSADFHFVPDGIEAAVTKAQQLAGSSVVGVAAGTVAGQALEAGLLDRVSVDLVPIVMGAGRRYFGDRTTPTKRLGDPMSVVQGLRVTHLMFPVAS